MKIDIQKKFKAKIPDEFLSFVEKVSDGEGLDDWELDIWDIYGESECIDDMRLIHMGIQKFGILWKRVCFRC